ncbi:MAG: hypothetical protein EAX86_02715 [Candidatus Heimdallarchaeota archaeon]|nr:hypothetical protein [Candidatus Heimdallarchaeota archaeon]
MPKRKYKSKWYRYGSLIGVLLVAIGGLFMILLGIQALLTQQTPPAFLLTNFFNLDVNLSFLWSLVTIICGIAVLIVTTMQKPHDSKTTSWIVIAAFLGIIGGTVGGLIAFSGALIYFIFYIL